MPKLTLSSGSGTAVDGTLVHPVEGHVHRNASSVATAAPEKLAQTHRFQLPDFGYDLLYLLLEFDEKP